MATMIYNVTAVLMDEQHTVLPNAYVVVEGTKIRSVSTQRPWGSFEEQIDGLIAQCAALLSDNPLFFAVNSYTAGLSPSVMTYMLNTRLLPRFGGGTQADEIGLPVMCGGFSPPRVLPCGATALWLSAGASDKPDEGGEGHGYASGGRRVFSV